LKRAGRMSTSGSTRWPAILLEMSGDDAGVLQQAQVLNREADVTFPSMVGQLRLYEALLTGQVQINSPR
jgi:hypothetical protein